MILHFAVIGDSGQVGRALLREIPAAGHRVSGVNRQDIDLSIDPVQLKRKVERYFAQKDIDVVVLAAAYTAVDRAETEQALAFAVNEVATKIIAAFCLEADIPLIYISTDYVFNGGSKTPYLSTDQPDPINLYGASKLAGENAIKASKCRAVVLRTSWIFDGSGRNFLTKMLKLGQDRDEVFVVDDQIGRPTYAGHFAQAVIATALGIKPKGGEARLENQVEFYHVTGAGEPVSWAGFARAVFAAADVPELPHMVKVVPVPSSHYPMPAARPAFSVLDILDFEARFGYRLPDWREGLHAALFETDSNKG